MPLRDRIVILGLVAITATACTGDSPVERPESPPTTQPIAAPPSTEALPDLGGIDLVEVEVVRVDDGDSMRVIFDGAEERVRLLGINAPERDECLGDASRESLSELVGDSVVLGLEPESRDQFGRLLAHVFAGDLYVNRAQVAAGLAIVFSDPHAFHEELLTAQDAAEVADAGLWSDEACGGGPLPTGIQIDWIEPNPPGPDEDALDEEAVAITNHSDVAADLSGFVLRDESTANRFVFAEGTVLEPGDTIEVVSGCDPPGDALAWCADGPIWNNGGDSALLLDPNGRVVDHYQY